MPYSIEIVSWRHFTPCIAATVSLTVANCQVFLRQRLVVLHICVSASLMPSTRPRLCVQSLMLEEVWVRVGLPHQQPISYASPSAYYREKYAVCESGVVQWKQWTQYGVSNLMKKIQGFILALNNYLVRHHVLWYCIITLFIVFFIVSLYFLLYYVLYLYCIVLWHMYGPVAIRLFSCSAASMYCMLQ